MADKHPYVSGNGVLIQVLDHLKRSFPTNLDAEVLKKLGYAPKNESYILNTIRFIKLIDEKGARTDKAQKTFTLHDPSSFTKAFSDIVKLAYGDLFRLHGEGAWNLDNAKLITYFRQTDQSSELVGTLQANTFKTLATYAGQGSAAQSPPKVRAKPLRNGKPRPADAVKSSQNPSGPLNADGSRPQGGGLPDHKVGLTVRIEINLPATGSRETYDNIFKSIRENLLDG